MQRKITNRLDLNIGKKCNNRCKFCYYLRDVDKQFNSLNELKSTLKKYKKFGIIKLHITGGEPLICDYIVDIVEFAKEMKFEDIAIITNGSNLKNEVLISNLSNAGVDSFIVSIHAHNAEIHNGLTQNKFSFQNILEGIEILKKLNIPFAVNFVINKLNYKYLSDFANFMLEIKPTEVAFLNLNPMDNAENSFNDLVFKYSELDNYVNQAIKILKSENIKYQIKFIPFCCLNSENKSALYNLPQALYEDWEWNYKVRYLLHYGNFTYLKNLLFSFKNFDKIQIKSIPFKSLEYLNVIFSIAHFYYQITSECEKCSHKLICEGVSKSYINLFGKEEIKAIGGNLIANSDYYLNPSENLKINLSDRILNNMFYNLSKLINKPKRLC